MSATVTVRKVEIMWVQEIGELQWFDGQTTQYFVVCGLPQMPYSGVVEVRCMDRDLGGVYKIDELVTAEKYQEALNSLSNPEVFVNEYPCMRTFSGTWCITRYKPVSVITLAHEQ